MTRRNGARGAGRMPDFLGIGAQKSGTTWLYRNLQQHPDIWLPPEKELHYFDEKIAQQSWSLRQKLRSDSPEAERWRRQARRQLWPVDGRPKLRGTSWQRRYLFRRMNDEWYASLFAPAQGKVTGEITPDYATLDEDRIRHIHRLMPDVKLIFFMRNPIERAWSHAGMQLRSTSYQQQFPDALSAFRAHAKSQRSQERSDYMRTLRAWTSVFAPQQLFVGYLEDVHFRPRELLRRLCRFLGIAPAPPSPDIRRKVHKGTSDHIPLEVARYLAELHGARLERLARVLGGHAAWWQFTGARLAQRDDGGDDARIGYPLFETELWDQWLTEQGLEGPPPLQSGPLRRNWASAGRRGSEPGTLPT